MRVKRGEVYCFAILWVIYLVISFSENAGAIGVSPAGYSLDFQPGFKGAFSFDFRGGSPDVKYNIFVFGDLAEYIELSEKYFYEGGNVNVLLKLPKKIDKPGVHRIRIGLDPQFAKEQNFTSTVVVLASVIGVIDVRVPYPGRYAEMEFSTTNANAGEPVNFKLKVYSRGDEDIVTTSYVEIYDARNKKVDTITLGINEIKSKENVEINKEVDTKNYPAGKYTAKAVVQYYDKEIQIEAPFRLGELNVNIVDYKKEFDKNKINPITIDVESSWNDPIENVYAEVTILGYESLIPAFKTPSVSLQGFERKTLEGFFDTTAIKENSFKVKITLHYLDKTTEKTVDLRFKRIINYILIGAIAGAVLLVIIILFLIFWIRKLKKNVKKGKK